MNTTEIAKNAHRIWQLMNDGTTWCYDKLREASQLSDREINAAIGWLAREDTVEILETPGAKKDSYKIRPFWELGGC